MKPHFEKLMWCKVALATCCICASVWSQSNAVESHPTEASENPGSPSTKLSDSVNLEVVHSEPATYPVAARQLGVQGQVIVKVLISEDGHVETAEVVSGDSMLAKAALDAVKKWKFKPFIRNGKVVKVSTKLPFNFAFKGQVVDNPVSTTDPTQQSLKASEPASDVLRVGSGVSQGMLIHQVRPVYPADAKSRHIQGTVLLNAVIDKEGRVQNLTAISGPKELIPAAIGAVQQWRYRPYYLKGNPVAVTTTITINFTLR